MSDMQSCLNDTASINSCSMAQTKGFNFTFLMYVLALSVASIFVIYRGAYDEPYFHFKPSDCLIQVGAGIALLVLWAQLAIGVVVGVLSSRLSRYFLFILLWALIVCFYLYISPFGYVSDIISPEAG